MAFDAGSLVSKLKLDKSGWNTSVSGVEKDTKKMGGFMTRNGAKMKKMGTTMTVAGAAIVGSLGMMVKKFVETGDWIDKMAKRTGFSATALSELAHAADISGANLDNLEKGVKKMAKSLVDADRGLETYTISFDRLGLSVSDLMEMTPEEQFMKIGTAIGEMESPTLRAATAQEIFGRAGTTLLPLFAEGEKGMAALREEAHKLGIIFDEEAAAKAAKLKDEQTRLSASMKGLGFTLASTLVPVLTDLVTKITGVTTKIVAWTKENPKLAATIMKIVAALGAFLTVFGPLLIVLPNIIKSIGHLKKALIGIKAASVISAAGIGIVIVAAVKAHKIISDLIKAKNKMIDADLRAAQAEHKLGQKLREITDAAGMTRREMIQLTRKYEGNTAALVMAIKHGKEGKELQEAMTKVGAEHKKVIDKQREAIEKSTPSLKDFNVELGTVGEKTKTWLDYIKNIGIKTVKEKQERVVELEGYIEQLNKAYEDGIVDLEDYTAATKAAKEEIRELSETIPVTIIPAARDMAGVLDSAVGDMEGRVGDFTETVKTESVEVKSVWDQMADGIQTKMATTWSAMLQGTTSFKDGFLGILGAIKQNFFDMIGSMIAEWTVNFIGGIVTSLAPTAAEITSKLGGAIDKIGEAAEAAGGGLGASIVALAKGIATAAKIIAGAAKEILIAAAVAAAIFAGFSILKKLFGGGGGKVMDATNRELHNIWIEARNSWQELMEIKGISLEMMRTLWNINSRGEGSGGAGSAQLGEILGAAWRRNDILRDIRKSISGIGRRRKKPISGPGTLRIGGEQPEILGMGAIRGGDIIGGGGAGEIIGPAEIRPREPGRRGEPGGGAKQVVIKIDMTNRFDISTLDPRSMRRIVHQEILPLIIESFDRPRIKTKIKEKMGI